MLSEPDVHEGTPRMECECEVPDVVSPGAFVDQAAWKSEPHIYVSAFLAMMVKV